MLPKPAYPSIQSFYKREIAKPGENIEITEVESIQPGDGFTEEELADALDPLNRKWNPEREYQEMTISELIPGPRAVTFAGRVVKINTLLGEPKKQPKAAGYHYLLLKDDSAAISIKLCFSRDRYPLKLGQLLTIWTVFISDASKSEKNPISGVINSANLFPGRVTSDHIMIHTTASSDSICRVPLGYHGGVPLVGLMTLDSYLASGHDGVTGAKLLVCVKSMGPRRNAKGPSGKENDLMEVHLFDHTNEIKLTVWNELIDSAKSWEPGKTVLLLTNPGYKVAERSSKGSISLQHSSMVDVDPVYPDAEWLKKYAAGLTKKDSVAMAFPEDVWDVEAAEYGANVILFTLAEIDEMVRADPSQVFTGHINVTIMEMFLVRNYQRRMLMCTECCGIPIYANTPTLPCSNCAKPLTLLLNPKIIGPLLDETGCIASGKLLWSDRAWEQLLGRRVQDVLKMSADEVRWLEQRMVFMRMHLVVGWEEGVGRLGVLGMRA